MGEDSKVPPLSRRVPGATSHLRPAGRVAPPRLPESLLQSVRAALDAEPKPEPDQQHAASPDQPSSKASQPSRNPPDAPSATPGAGPESLPRRMPGTTYGPKPPKRAARPMLPASLLGRRTGPEPEAAPEDATQPIPAISEALLSQLASPAVDEDLASPAGPPGEAPAPPIQTASPKQTAPAEQTAAAETVPPQQAAPPDQTAARDKAAARGDAAPPAHAPKTRTDGRAATAAPAANGKASARAARTIFRGAGSAIPATRDSRPATNGRPAANGRPAEAAGGRKRLPAAPAAAEWWVQDRDHSRKPRTGRRYRLIGVVASVIVLVAAGSVVFAVSQSAGGNRRDTPSAAQLRAEVAARGLAATWVATQVSRSSLVACDPVMCRALQARGFPGVELLPLDPAAPYPVNSAVVVATPAVRRQFGSSLAAAYAPAVLASFGTGIVRIDVRVIAPRGSADYLVRLKADVADRKTSAPELLRSPRFTVPVAAARQLEAGNVDTRLLVAMEGLSPVSPMTIVGFGDSGPDASAGIPLRSVDLTGTNGATLTRNSAYVTSVLKQLSSLPPPYRPSLVQLVRAAGGQTFLRIEFAAPSPLGLIGPP
jgi:hypothetical protein